MLPTAKNQKKRLTNRTGRCTIQLSTNRVTPLCPCHPPVGYSPFYPTTHHHRERYGAPCGRLGEGERAAERLLFFIFGGIMGPRPRGNGRGENTAPGRRKCVRAPLLIAGISSAERVPCFSSECRPFAGTRPAPGGGARHAPAGSAAGRRLAAAARHPGPRPAGAYRS